MCNFDSHATCYVLTKTYRFLNKAEVIAGKETEIKDSANKLISFEIQSNVKVTSFLELLSIIGFS